VIRLTASLLILLLGAAAGVGLVACGDEESDAKLLPAKNAEEIDRNLAELEELLEMCELAGAEDAARDVETEVAKVEDRIDPELRENLLEGVERLREEIDAEDCDEEPAETTDEEPVEVPTEEPTTSETTEEEPETTEETTTTEEPPPAEETEEQPPPSPPAEEPNDDSGGGPAPGVPPSSGGVGPGQSADRSAG
jgi:outer membrane biosynthesis protein TonB